MAVFHVNPKTLEPGRCRAQKKCPFGGEENHFASQGEAQKVAEERLKASYDVFAQRGDYAVDEEVQLGPFYDTPGGRAKVIEIEKDSVKVQSLDDYETYWVPKEFANNPRSVNYLGRKNSAGNFVTAEEAAYVIPEED